MVFSVIDILLDRLELLLLRLLFFALSKDSHLFVILSLTNLLDQNILIHSHLLHQAVRTIVNLDVGIIFNKFKSVRQLTSLVNLSVRCV